MPSLTGAAFALVAADSYYYAWFLGWFTLLVVYYVRRCRPCAAIRAGPFDRFDMCFAQGFTRAASRSESLWSLRRRFLLDLRACSRGGRALGARASDLPKPCATRRGRGCSSSLRTTIPLSASQVRRWVTAHIFDSPVYEQSIYLGYACSRSS